MLLLWPFVAATGVADAFQPPRTLFATKKNRCCLFGTGMNSDTLLSKTLEHSRSWRDRFSRFLKEQVVEELNFCAHDVERNVAVRSLPVLSVGNVGRIGYPLSKAQASEIILSGVANSCTCESDVSAVKKCWELELSQVSFKDVQEEEQEELDGDERNWPGKLESIVDEAVKTMGVEPPQEQGKVSCELQKVLLCEEGGCLKPTDCCFGSEDGTTFATLAIQLPSCFEGGAMTVEYGSILSHRINLERWSGSTLKWIAWSVGSHVEMEPITSGNHLVLVYHLKMADTTDTDKNKKPFCPSKENLHDLNNLVDEWKERIKKRLLNENLPTHDDDEWMNNDFVNDICFVHRLDHPYTAPGRCDTGSPQDDNYLHKFQVLGPDSGDLPRLIGRDRNIANVLAMASVHVQLVIQDYGTDDRDVNLERGEAYQHALWNVAWLSPCGDDGGDEEFRLTQDNSCPGWPPGGFMCWDYEDSSDYYYMRYRVAFLIVRPKL